MLEYIPVARLALARDPDRPFDPSGELARLHKERPLERSAFSDGHPLWVVTDRAWVRAILADPRFSVRYDLLHQPGGGTMPPARPGDMTGLDAPEHTRYRRLLTGEFTVRRMRRLTARIEAVTEERLAEMERLGPPADLVEVFARPIPALMICELLGVPYAERERFEGDAILLTGGDADIETANTAGAALYAYLSELVAAKRANPTDDLLSGLTTSDLSDDELTMMGLVLLGAGLDTTANMLSLGTFALLQNPAQLAALRENPAIADSAVEELLRYLSVVPFLTRTALEDVEIDGQVIKAGESALLIISTANRDPGHFPDPDVLDLRRPAGGHNAFGHGIHQCLGQQLARVVMQVAYPALVARFPRLRLAVPPQEVPLRENAVILGVQKLPVEW
ncbi:cytochrome P450 [Spongiactinospora gelatinilytica]|uniref:Cytochrome P450 n=1 Tax=Spongiactinospora gelatinilytica TaxID=2666298 RepID=A0A2W2H0X9_9ACTN|nr:cytochrome P450 [Spongiactinospora gelatinilytica]PZG55666.1 cytochrome P450 [Spongiactinospora gelatinilytica]